VFCGLSRYHETGSFDRKVPVNAYLVLDFILCVFLAFPFFGVGALQMGANWSLEYR
jgi:hypothetical protein